MLLYELLPGLNLKANLGYATMHLQQVFIYPGASLNPAYNFTGFAQYGNSDLRNWIIEPQANYIKTIGSGKLDILIGTSFQQEKTIAGITNASNFSSDALLESPSSAGSVTANNTYNLYRYQSVFGRVNFNWDNKYILNLTGRRDGSSRFGPDKQFSNFGAIGGAWIFSKESFIQDHLSFLSFGKLRGSYGITGNDKIGDYQYLNTYSSFQYPYQGQVGLIPTQLYNPDYGWETNRKLEAGLELGFIKDRIIVISSYYFNRSSNQLVNYTLPIQTGFNGVNENFPALVQNNGWEFQLNLSIVKAKSFTWDASLNLTIPRNKLLEFPNLASSSYASKYQIGKPLNMVKLIHATGVDPQTGIYQFADNKGQPTSTPVFPDDYTVIKDLTPACYGGFSNRFQYKQFSLALFFQFVKEDGYNYMYNNGTPGSLVNQPVNVLNRWQKPGDITNTQRYATIDPANTAYYYYSSASDAIVSNASYIRLKNLSFSYALPPEWSSKIKSELIRVYLQGQNLVTLTHYKGSDPETRSIVSLPPLKMLTAGIQITF
jgi:TonB-linked SusC/RagA family outer membrane protein